MPTGSTNSSPKYGTAMAPQDANNAVKQEIGTVFSHVLENAGVFKQDKTGQDAFLRFVEGVGFHTGADLPQDKKHREAALPGVFYISCPWP